MSNSTDSCALLLLAHGSSNESWSRSFFKLKKKLNEKMGTVCIELAFLEKSEPCLEDEVERMLKQGIKHISILPLFLAVGWHIKEDLPQRLRALEKKFPSLSFRCQDALGELDSFCEFLEQLAKQSLNSIH